MPYYTPKQQKNLNNYVNRVQTVRKSYTKLDKEYGTHLGRQLSHILGTAVDSLLADPLELAKAIQKGPSGIKTYLKENAHVYKSIIADAVKTGKIAYSDLADVYDALDSANAAKGRAQAKARGLEKKVQSMEKTFKKANTWKRGHDKLNAIVKAARDFKVTPGQKPNKEDVDYLNNL